MSFTVIAVRIRRDFECFYFCVDVLDNNPFARKAFIVCLVFFTQFVILAFLSGYSAVRVKIPYPQIAKIGIYRY